MVKEETARVSIKVRSDNGTGKLLFEWSPEDNTVTLIQKGTVYRVKLVKTDKNSTYRVLDKRPKHGN